MLTQFIRRADGLDCTDLGVALPLQQHSFLNANLGADHLYALLGNNVSRKDA